MSRARARAHALERERESEGVVTRDRLFIHIFPKTNINGLVITYRPSLYLYLALRQRFDVNATDLINYPRPLRRAPRNKNEKYFPCITIVIN